MPQIKAVPWPQAAGAYAGAGQGIKGECPTDALTVLRSAEESVFSSGCAHVDATEVSSALQCF